MQTEDGAEHPGSLLVHGRGSNRHYWSCCGAKLEGELISDLDLAVEDAKERVQFLQKQTRMEQGQQRRRAPKRGGAVPPPPDDAAALRAAQAERKDAQGQLDQMVSKLRRSDPCSAADRERWEGTGMHKYMLHLYELIKTEEVYVKRLHFALHVYYLPLSTGSHHAPKLSPLEIEGLFSGLVIQEIRQDPDGKRDHGPTIPSGSTGHLDIIKFHSEVFLKLLLEEEREPVPDIGSMFQRMVAGKPMIEHMNMYAAYAAHHSTTKTLIQRFVQENPKFKAFLEQEADHWFTAAAQRRLRHQGIRNLSTDLEKTLFVP